jgi:hypothetical protein
MRGVALQVLPELLLELLQLLLLLLRRRRKMWLWAVALLRSYQL